MHYQSQHEPAASGILNDSRKTHRVFYEASDDHLGSMRAVSAKVGQEVGAEALSLAARHLTLPSMTSVKTHAHE